MPTRSIKRIHTPDAPAPGFLGPGHTAVDAVSPTALRSSDPFVLLMDDRLDLPDRRRIGGAHPHAGLETVTLVIEGELHDRDEGELATGDVVWMTAGRGIIHNEDVEAGGRSRILQLWIALPERDRDLAPNFEILRKRAMPVVRTPGAEAVLYSGTSGSVRSATRNRVPVTMIDLSLDADATFHQQLPASFNGFFYVLDGSVHVDETTISAGQVGWLDDSSSDDLVFTTRERGARLVLYAGERLDEPVVQRGPFVAGTPNQISEYNRRFHAGEFTTMSQLASATSRSS